MLLRALGYSTNTDIFNAFGTTKSLNPKKDNMSEYIERENTSYDLYNKFLKYDDDKENGILVEIDGKNFTQEDFGYVQQLAEIIADSGEPGAFDLGNLHITINSLKTFEKASLCRNFENEVFKRVNEKIINFPVYLSAGQEYVPSSIAQIVKDNKQKPLIFGQHRGHSIYLAFGGNLNQYYFQVLIGDIEMALALETIADVYSQDGFVFPIDVVSEAEASAIQADLEKAES